MISYKFNFVMAFLVALVAIAVFLLGGKDDPSVLPAIVILGGGSTLYFLIEGLIRYLGLKE